MCLQLQLNVRCRCALVALISTLLIVTAASRSWADEAAATQPDGAEHDPGLLDLLTARDQARQHIAQLNDQSVASADSKMVDARQALSQTQTKLAAKINAICRASTSNAGPDATADAHLTDVQQRQAQRALQDYQERLRSARAQLLLALSSNLTASEFSALLAARPPELAFVAADESNPTTAPAVATQASSALPNDAVALTFSGGHDTDPRDHGRPVILVASALGVPADVFRDAFTHVHPAGPGSGGPTDAEARANKQQLMQRLAPLGVTDDRLNEVSNYYRYMRPRQNLWRHVDATGYAIVVNGVVHKIVLTNPGAGYTTAPTLTLSDGTPVSATVKIKFATDLATNGAIDSITLNPKG